METTEQLEPLKPLEPPAMETLGGNAGSSGQGGAVAGADAVKLSNSAVEKVTVPTMNITTIQTRWQ